MAVEFKTVEAIDSLVALLRVAEDSAVDHYEQDEAFHPGIFPGLILLARFAAERAGTEYRLALEVAEKNRRSYAERDITNEQLAQVTAERDELRAQVAELTKKVGELPAEPAPEQYPWQVGDEIWTTDGVVETIEKRHADGTISLWDRTGVYTVEELHKQGWKLFRKASDSTGTDGEGQS
jgi:hypothetical protein